MTKEKMLDKNYEAWREAKTEHFAKANERCNGKFELGYGFQEGANATRDRYLPMIGLLIGVLETLEVAVNDKVKDPGATLFIQKNLAQIRKELGE